MNKNLWDISMMKVVKELEVHSKCAAKKVCCTIVKEENGNYNILSIGLNGTVSKVKNCNEQWERVTDENGEKAWKNKVTKVVSKDGHNKWSSLNEVHAEVNALSKCCKQFLSTEGTYAFISFSPCYNCAKMLVTFGVKKVYFYEKYDDHEDVMKFLKRHNVEVIHLTKKDGEEGEWISTKI